MLELSATESHSWVLPIRMPGVLIPHTPLPPLLLRKNQSVLFVQLFQASEEPMTFPIRSAIPSELTSQLGSELILFFFVFRALFTTAPVVFITAKIAFIFTFIPFES